VEIKFTLCGIVLAALVTPALAANKFYVVRDSTTMECSIVGQKPTVAALKLVGTAYKTEARAEKAMQASEICETN
jgi:hypothetical protein